MTACGPGAHCLASALVPADMADQLAACPDGQSMCVPDEFIRSGGNFIPTGQESNRVLVDLHAAEPQVGIVWSNTNPSGVGSRSVLYYCTNTCDEPLFWIVDGYRTNVQRHYLSGGPRRGPLRGNHEGPGAFPRRKF
jgi:hypothetical protein